MLDENLVQTGVYTYCIVVLCLTMASVQTAVCTEAMQ